MQDPEGIAKLFDLYGLAAIAGLSVLGNVALVYKIFWMYNKSIELTQKVTEAINAMNSLFK